jgi:signal transduction histidine kinase
LITPLIKAQNLYQSKKDSLLKLLNKHPKQDSSRVKILLQLTYLNNPNYPAEAKSYVEQALKLAQKLKITNLEGDVLFALGNVYFQQGIYLKAAEEFYKSLAIAEKNNYTELIINNLNSLGLCFYYQKQYQQAENFFIKALEKSEKTTNKQFKGQIIGNLGMISGEQKKYEKEREYYQQSIQIYEKIKDSLGLSIIYNNIGESFFEEDKPYLALYNYEKSSKISEKIEDFVGVAYALINTAKVYLKLNNPDEAEKYALSGLALVEKYQIAELKAELYKTFSAIYELGKNYESSLKYQKMYAEHLDKNYNQDSQTRLAQLQSLYLNAQKDRENESLKKEQAENNNIILRQRIIFGVFGVGVIVLLGLLGLLFWANKRKTKFNETLKTQKEEISRQKAELAEINQVKDKLFSIIAHDFRGPLNSLQGVLSLVNTQELSEKEIKYILSGLKDKLNDTQTLLENLLNWTKSQMQGIEINPITLNFSKIVEDTIRLLFPYAENKGISFVKQVPDNLLVKCDVDSLRLILRNLFTNALKFSFPSNPIEIETQIIDQSFVKIAVKDKGMGISRENLAKLFKPQYHYTSAGTANEKGTGLGLLLTKDFVELNGGQIWVESIENQGSTFYFTLPMVAN